MIRPRSLFWTFAGVFLLVLVAATALQAIVSVAVLRPVQLQREQEHAELALGHAADELALLGDPRDDQEVIRVLRANRIESGDVLLVFQAADGHLVPERAVAAELERRFAALLPAPFAPHPQPAPPADARPAPARDDHAPPPVEAPRGARTELLGLRAVRAGAGAVAHVAAVRIRSAPSPWTLPEARALLVFLPFAVLAAAIAGLLMVRLLVRRLRELERLAGRVAAGDLVARVERPLDDEIGRLGERFNVMTERLGAARAQLEATDLQRRRLLADITHELATPLTSIRGYVETLLDPAVPTTPEERTAYLKDVLAEAERLDLLTGDLFDLARLEAESQLLALQGLDWTALCRNTVRRFEPRFREAGLTLEWAGPADEAWVRADGRRLEQVAENLLVNALRYVPAGGTVRMSLAREAARYRLTVSDDGPGIAPADLPHVFERFYRAESARGASGGSGLGLAIVREIVRRHGGEVRAEPRAPHGAAFFVELPPLDA